MNEMRGTMQLSVDHACHARLQVAFFWRHLEAGTEKYKHQTAENEIVPAGCRENTRCADTVTGAVIKSCSGLSASPYLAGRDADNKA